MTITTRQLRVQDGARVSASSSTTGNGGNLTVRASEIKLIGTTADGQFPSGLFTQTQGDGDAGDLTIDTRQLRVQDGAQLVASNFGLGKGGDLTVVASDSVELAGTSPNGQLSSLLSTNTQGTGKAGSLAITTPRLRVQDGAQVSVSTRGAGAAGTLDINARESVEVSGRGSGLFNRTGSTGDAGTLKITTEELTIQNEAQVSVDNFIPIDFRSR